MRDRLQQELRQWDRAVAQSPNDPRFYVRRGMARFKLAQITESIADFDRAEQLDPQITPYLWQRGLSYYYAGQFEAGANQFEMDLTVNSHDVEETVWRYLCIAQRSGTEAARHALLEVRQDARPIMQPIYQLFVGTISVETVLASGATQGNSGRFYSHLYIGLYSEAEGKTEQARSYINQAVQIFTTQYRADDYMGYLAIVHQQLRGWKF